MEIHPTHQGMGWDGEHMKEKNKKEWVSTRAAKKSIFFTIILVQKQK